MGRGPGRSWLLVVTILAASVGSGAVSATVSTRPQAPPTPMQLFSRMLPAIRHARCSNCHGGVDPRSGINHIGGVIPPDSDCTDCHTDVQEEWQIPGNEHFFAGRTDRQICGQIADFITSVGQRSFIEDHVKTDEQILLAFEGFAGGAREPGKRAPNGSIFPPKDPPRMSHKDFVQAAIDWVNQGGAACDPEGTITVEEGVNSTETVRLTPNSMTRISQTGNRTVVITSVTGGGWRADIAVDGEIINQSTITSTNAAGATCTVITTIRDQYSGRTSGPAYVAVKDTVFRLDLRPPKGDYRIDVTLPAETTRRTETTNIQDGCGTGLKANPLDVQNFEWSGYEFTLEGNLEDVKQRNAAGGCAKTIMWNEVGESQDATHCNRWANMGNAVEPWLVNHGAANSFQTGKPIPFQIVWTWNLRRR